MTDSKTNNNQHDIPRERLFLRLYQTNERRVYGFILSLVPVWSEADDIMQETIMVMWSKFDEFEPGTDFVAWALCIARYQVLNYRKKKQTEKVRFSNQAIEAIADRVAAVGDKQDDRREALRKCLKKLKPRDCKLLQLRYELGATTRSVAQRVGRGVDAVYKALNITHIQLLHCIRRTLATEESS
jgi:RNA polymerase sigma-70 factor, ECF subfamily